jgi:hypothetical protein
MVSASATIDKGKHTLSYQRCKGCGRQGGYEYDGVHGDDARRLFQSIKKITGEIE